MQNYNDTYHKKTPLHNQNPGVESTNCHFQWQVATSGKTWSKPIMMLPLSSQQSSHQSITFLHGLSNIGVGQSQASQTKRAVRAQNIAEYPNSRRISQFSPNNTKYPDRCSTPPPPDLGQSTQSQCKLCKQCKLCSPMLI